uniref:RNA-dependent RNA polymerase n=1 Tax=Hubei insect virus 1 TaxID=1922897 RepID=A0A1L3KPA6_9VIRU|nr:RNA-dependent RNA polymerase [Hubei insect virus 1]
MELIDNIRRNYDLEIWRQSGLRCRGEMLTHHPTQPIPDLQDYMMVHLLEGKLSWRFDMPEDLVETSSLGTEISRQSRLVDAYKIRHEFVGEGVMLGGSDTRLDKIFGKSPDEPIEETDKLTPDFSLTDTTGVTHIIEVGTCRSNDMRTIKNVFDEKIFKYKETLENRSTNRITTYTVIITTPRYVMSNIDLDNEIVNDMHLRMKIGMALEDKATESGIDIFIGQEKSEADKIASMIGDEIKKIGFKNPPIDDYKVFITRDFIDECLRPPDEKLVQELYFKSRREAMRIDVAPDHNKLMKDYLEDVRDVKETRCDMKPTCNFPFIVMDPKKNSTEGIPRYPVGGDAPDYLMTLWTRALRSLKDNSSESRPTYSLINEAYETRQEVLKAMEADRLSKRGALSKVDVSPALTSKVLLSLQRDGIFGKRAKKEIQQRVRRHQQSLPFNWDTRLDDIDEFMNKTDLYDKLDEIPKTQGSPMRLVQESHDAMENSFDLGKVRDWMKTKWFHGLDLMSDIAVELSLSIKQNTKNGEMICKRLRNHEAYILIKTTNSDSHIFFSLYIPRKSFLKHKEDLPFRRMYTTGSGYMTDFVSFLKDKLGNILNASSRFLTLVSFWCDFYGVTDFCVDSFRKCKEATQMLNVSMLISLENKAETEESITQTRYMYMEVFKSIQSRSKPNPLKVLSKLTVIPRSRLNLWVLRKVVTGFGAMTSFPPMRVVVNQEEQNDADADDVLPGDQWKNLKNFFTGGTLGSATSAVNIMYLGYLKDKNEEGQGNTEWKLVEKIVEEECKLRIKKRHEQYGRITSDDEMPKGKGFSLDAVIYGCSTLEMRLRKDLGPNWKSKLNNEILHSLGRQLTHELASLKASSCIDHMKVDKDSSDEDKKHVVRVKVLEALACRLNKVGLNPFFGLKDMLEYVENTSKGIICDLFKKQQHGGLREIYVLTIESRILQLLVESISRTICTRFDEETLTHPDHKLKLLDEHKVRSSQISRVRGSIFADFCSSSDKTRWNQNFIMTAMSVPLFRLTEQYLHPAIMRTLNLWANKLIKLPPNVVKMLSEKTMISSDTYEKLYTKFHGGTIRGMDAPIVKKRRSAFLNLTTGMMQGILHYTSSLLHVCLLSAFKKISLMYLKKKHGSEHLRFTMTCVCSSDDSATILTAFSSKKAENFKMSDIKAFFDCDVVLHTMTKFCQYFSMVESVKSTTALYDYVEFNSEFLFKNTIAMPVIKFVAACLTISESESFMRRQFEMYNLISSLSGSGFPFLNTYFCQVAQALLHYKTLGSSNTELFEHYEERIKEYPDLVHGFFLMDKDVLCGVAGISYSRWKHCQKYPRLYAGLALHKNEESDIAEDGTVVDSLVVRHGEHYRWYKLLDRVHDGKLHVESVSAKKKPGTAEKEVDQKLVASKMALINESPEVLYRHPTTKAELRIKLLSKALSPGVSKSLKKGNPVVQSFASTAYTLYSHCFTRCSTHKRIGDDKEMRRKLTKKYSLLSSLKERKEYADEVLQTAVGVTELEDMFPLHDSYQEIEDVVQQFRMSDFVECRPIRQKKHFIRLLAGYDKLPLTLLQIVGIKWFGFSHKSSNSVINRCFDAYCAKYQWLRGDLESSLKASPFDRHTELHSFISSQTNQSRMYCRVGPTISTMRFSHRIHQMIRKGALRGHKLEPRSYGEEGQQLPEPGFRQSAFEREKLESELSLALFIPLEFKRDVITRAVLAKLARSRPRLSDWMDCPRWEFEVGMMALYLESKISYQDMMDAIKNKGAGIRIVYTKPQEKNSDGTWSGEGECLVNAEGYQLKVELRNDEVVRICVKNPKDLIKRPDLLKDLFERLRSRPLRTPVYTVNCLYRFNGTRFAHASSVGTPIVHDDDIFVMHLYPTHIGFRVKHGMCSLRVLDDRPYNLISFKSKSWACAMTGHTGPEAKDPWDAWVHQKPVSAIGAVGMLVELKERIDSPNRPGRSESEDNCWVGWVRESLTNRLKYKNIGFTTLLDHPSDLATTEDRSIKADAGLCTDEDLQDWLLEEYEESKEEEQEALQFFSDQLVDSVKDQIICDFSGNAPEDMLDCDLMDFMQTSYDYSPFRPVLRNWIFEDSELLTSVISTEARNFYSLHPFWDNFISACTARDRAFFDKTLSGIVVSSDQDLSRLLQAILSIKMTNVEISLMEQYLRSKPGYIDEAGPSNEPPVAVQDQEGNERVDLVDSDGEEGPAGQDWWDV